MCRCREHPWAPGLLRTPHTAHHQAPLSTQGHRVVVVPGCHGSLRIETLPQVASVGKNIRVLKTPAGESAANSLWTESLGRWPGNVGEMCGCCDDPCTPRDLHNTHTFHPTCPNIRPKDSVRRESRHHPSGVSSDT